MLFRKKSPRPVETLVAAGDGSTVPKKPRNRRRKIIVSILLIMLLITGGATFALIRIMMGPAEGVVINSFPEARSTEPVVELEQFEGKFFTFAYPNTYVVQPQRKDDTNNLETNTFIASGMMNKILTVTVTSLPSGKLEDDASYYMRSLNLQTYQMKAQSAQGERVVVALNTKDSQQAAFWVHKSASGNMLLTFAVSSVSINSQATAQEYQTMLESIRWR